MFTSKGMTMFYSLASSSYWTDSVQTSSKKLLFTHLSYAENFDYVTNHLELDIITATAIA